MTTELSALEDAIREAIEEGDEETAASLSCDNRVALVFHVTCYQGYSIHDQGSGVALTGWGEDTNYFHGSDDGGVLYHLPEGYEVHMCKYGELAIFHGDRNCGLFLQRKTVCISGPAGGVIGLKPA